MILYLLGEQRFKNFFCFPLYAMQTYVILTQTMTKVFRPWLKEFACLKIQQYSD